MTRKQVIEPVFKTKLPQREKMSITHLTVAQGLYNSRQLKKLQRVLYGKSKDSAGPFNEFLKD